MRLPREQEQELSNNGFHGVYTLPRYWHERGLSSILLAGALNLLALSSTAAFSTFLLLFVDWRALHAECLAPRAAGGGGGDCDLAAVALDRRPLLGRGVASDMLAVSYIAVCVVYLGWTAAHYVMDVRDMREVSHFMASKLGISEGKVVTMTWAEVVHRLVLVQRTTRLCIARDLDELHIVSRIMRKLLFPYAAVNWRHDNYLIAMINRNVLQLHLQPPADAPLAVQRVLGAVLRLFGGGGPSRGGGSAGGGGGGGGGAGCCGGRLLTKTLEWNLRWCVLDHMFDDRFRIRPEFSDVAALKRRLRAVACANVLLSPFLFMFLLAYFFMRNAERLYHHPGALGSRRWSGLAQWRIRELNELPHYLHHSSRRTRWRHLPGFWSSQRGVVAGYHDGGAGGVQVPSEGVWGGEGQEEVLSLNESLNPQCEVHAPDPQFEKAVRKTEYLACCAHKLNLGRTTDKKGNVTLVSEEPVAYDPERALADVVSYTHYLPRHWRGRAHTAEVQCAFLSMFRLKLGLFVEELASLITTPLFVSAFTTHVDGVGDVCSLALFDLARHGNAKFGAPVQAEKAFRSRQGKLEKSFLTFVATYPTWEPGEMGRRMLAALATNAGGGGGGSGAAATATTAAAAAGDSTSSDQHPLPRQAVDLLTYHPGPPTVFPYQAAAEAGKAAHVAEAAAAATALNRGVAASEFRSSSTKGVPPEEGGGGGARKGDTYSAVDASAVATAAPPPPPRMPQHDAGPRGIRRPQVPLHLQPYHGVTSYMSNTSASQLSWRPAAQSSSGAGVVPAGGSPPPSVASSQFSNLAAPYMQCYPVPLYYAQQQQLRHVQQQQYRRMYEHLMYGRPSAPLRDAVSAGGAPPPGLLPTPLSPPYHAPRMAGSSASVAGGGGAAAAAATAGWQHPSQLQLFDPSTSYSGMFHPFAFHGPHLVPLPYSPPVPALHPPPPPHPHLQHPVNQYQTRPEAHRGAASAAPSGIGGGGGGGATLAQGRVAPAAHDDDDDNPLSGGGFVELLPAVAAAPLPLPLLAPGPAVAAVASALRADPSLGFGPMEEADGFGLVPEALAPPATGGGGGGGAASSSGSSLGLMPRRWGSYGTPSRGLTERSVAPQAAATAAVLGDGGEVESPGVGGWYDRDCSYPQQQQQQQQHQPLQHIDALTAQLSALEESETVKQALTMVAYNPLARKDKKKLTGAILATDKAGRINERPFKDLDFVGHGWIGKEQKALRRENQELN
ncbi:hypothetical protein VOLCADRAFT_93324 [Volvox carteri f. nagariensis]|uniref:Autophagy-related protein 9 n=1 Tax=Volvox carteri f. nagariensis TaxID=3068 RepID=D8U1U5_VOLCA|nr:uncharacterized protein VOLCADRAFT_93324 [Volvox carteri f. nagariensis]EFJ46174.1 hypothetical protein VOLCADRAFT_93324 [Volvox carteri f. nagariensis]|eukprot:XP_002952621.1 hypothetical protein VOLCADRAFT_93324 [Volvox carteri f. nagariensis]